MLTSGARLDIIMERIKTILNPLIEKVRAKLEPLGFEVHPFKVEYNYKKC